ncbi:hypothetical protein GGR32_001053 [Mesonia hippocampi]|uniref:Uncharacterized protein n=1 Tax=Mesonia hippocampi TaxID=1628250 RepID=A0A840EQ96_9FLAO|nr:hypothetical protein [Mesonia hippocampi]MBB4118773.1 hypothetical protein [Mesonia hippocampi]
MRNIGKKSVLFVVLGFLPLLTQAQCAMCRAVLETQADGNAAEAINDGIVYLMIFPYLLMGGLGIFVWREMKKRNKKA